METIYWPINGPLVPRNFRGPMAQAVGLDLLERPSLQSQAQNALPPKLEEAYQDIVLLSSSKRDKML